jgi:hypothetical protein
MDNNAKAGKIVVTFADGRVLHALAPMGLPGTLATLGWDAAAARARMIEMEMTGVQILLHRADAMRALRRAGY